MTDRITALRALVDDLEAAIIAHGREFPNGNWREVNNRIGFLRLQIDDILAASERTLGRNGNSETVSILRAIIAQEGAE